MKPVVGKKFLTDKVNEESTISWHVEDDGYGFNASSSSKRSILKIRDCNKTAVIDFSYEDHTEYKQKLEKLNTLINELELFESALTDSWVKV